MDKKTIDGMKNQSFPSQQALDALNQRLRAKKPRTSLTVMLPLATVLLLFFVLFPTPQAGETNEKVVSEDTAAAEHLDVAIHLRSILANDDAEFMSGSVTHEAASPLFWEIQNQTGETLQLGSVIEILSATTQETVAEENIFVPEAFKHGATERFEIDTSKLTPGSYLIRITYRYPDDREEALYQTIQIVERND